jgi:hypothetical protein
MAGSVLEDISAQALATEDTAQLERVLALSQGLLVKVQAFALSLSIELPELPPEVGSEGDRANLRSVAPMYLASELEHAGLLPGVEMLAGLVVTGAINAELGPAGPQIIDFWRGRKDRLTKEERRAFFARLFGFPSETRLAGEGAVNEEFESALMGVAVELEQVEETRGYRSNARLIAAASTLAANLLARSGGMAAYVSRDLISAIQHALAILKQPAVQRAVGARGPWSALRAINQRYLDSSPEVPAHVTRGRAGTEILAWIAEVVPSISALTSTPPPEEIITAAADWLRATEMVAAPAGRD